MCTSLFTVPVCRVIWSSCSVLYLQLLIYVDYLDTLILSHTAVCENIKPLKMQKTCLPTRLWTYMFVTGQLWKGIIEHWRLGGAAQLWKGVGYRGREVLYAFGPGNKVKNNTKKVRSSQDNLQRKLCYHPVTCYTSGGGFYCWQIPWDQNNIYWQVFYQWETPYESMNTHTVIY